MPVISCNRNQRMRTAFGATPIGKADADQRARGFQQEIKRLQTEIGKTEDVIAGAEKRARDLQTRNRDLQTVLDRTEEAKSQH